MKKRKKPTRKIYIPKKKVEREEKEPRIYRIIWTIIVIGIVISFLILMATSTHVVGYDHFIGIPSEWVRTLFD
ncbi:hypothetical protein DXB65_03560 [Bacteroides oleiciplenus]|uniref:Uncharacterized protein n=1 Tax=Bacteroides oleiciplenus TaxID=626931 RepID=A0A3E5BP47_9BACE|nr:hypothetical protein DXB65_03560 [Bacteroides oleiciplenus]